MNAQLLVVHHTPSPTMAELLEAILNGSRDESISGVDVVVRPALSAGPSDVLACNGVLLVTPANIGYMSGAMKHFFDQVYYPCLEATVGLPYAMCVHGNLDTTGAVRSVEKIATGLKWRSVAAPLELTGTLAAQDRRAGWELGAVMAASLAAWLA